MKHPIKNRLSAGFGEKPLPESGTCARLQRFLLCLAISAALSVQAGIITYIHDPAGRLTTANYGGGKTIAYTYDAAGNLLQRTVTAGIVDSDNDGMDDAWEQQYFGNLSRDGTGDFDGDGASDLAEFLAGTLPNNPASVLKVTTLTTASSVSAAIEWASVPGKRYRVQFKDLIEAAAWTDLSGDVTAAGATSSKADTTIGTRPRRFYRVILVP